jgi:hypothetical protein
MFIASRQRKIIHCARTHIDPLHGLIANLENVLYASSHFLVFPLLILDIEMQPISGGRAARGP